VSLPALQPTECDSKISQVKLKVKLKVKVRKL